MLYIVTITINIQSCHKINQSCDAIVKVTEKVGEGYSLVIVFIKHFFFNQGTLVTDTHCKVRILYR